MKSVGANDQQKLLSRLDKLGVHMSDQTFAMQHNLSHQSQWNTIRQARWQANVSHNANCHKGVQLTISMVTLTANSKWNSVYKQLTMYLIAISCDVMGLPIVASYAVIFLDLKGKHVRCTISNLNNCTITQLHICKLQERKSNQEVPSSHRCHFLLTTPSCSVCHILLYLAIFPILWFCLLQVYPCYG